MLHLLYAYIILLLFSPCFAFQNINRREIIRGADWIKKKWTELKTSLTTIFADYERSGKNNADGDLEWMSEEEVGRYAYHTFSKSRKNVEVTRYAYALFNKSDFEHLGKALPPGCGIDRSLGKRGGGPEGDEEDSSDPSSRTSSRRSSRGRQEDDSGLAAALLDMSAREDTRERDKATKELNLRRLEIILQQRTEEQKDAAMNELIGMHRE